MESRLPNSPPPLWNESIISQAIIVFDEPHICSLLSIGWNYEYGGIFVIKNPTSEEITVFVIFV